MLCVKCGNQVVGKYGKYVSGRFCSRKCANSKTWSEAHKERLSKKMQGYRFGNADPNNPNRTNIPRQSLIIEKQCLTCGKKFQGKRQGRRTCSIECERHAPGRNGGYRLNSTRKIRSFYKGFWMDSGAERRFAELMDAHQINWIKNTKKAFIYRDKEGKQRKYYPDFYLPKYDYWVEIKGRWYRNKNDELKLAAVGKNIEMQLDKKIRVPSCVGSL